MGEAVLRLSLVDSASGQGLIYLRGGGFLGGSWMLFFWGGRGGRKWKLEGLGVKFKLEGLGVKFNGLGGGGGEASLCAPPPPPIPGGGVKGGGGGGGGAQEVEAG